MISPNYVNRSKILGEDRTNLQWMEFSYHLVLHAGICGGFYLLASSQVKLMTMILG
jgi:hypothetical protein